jgi:hypothetical protein
MVRLVLLGNVGSLEDAVVRDARPRDDPEDFAVGEDEVDYKGTRKSDFYAVLSNSEYEVARLNHGPVMDGTIDKSALNRLLFKTGAASFPPAGRFSPYGELSKYLRKLFETLVYIKIYGDQDYSRVALAEWKAPPLFDGEFRDDDVLAAAYVPTLPFGLGQDEVICFFLDPVKKVLLWDYRALFQAHVWDEFVESTQGGWAGFHSQALAEADPYEERVSEDLAAKGGGGANSPYDDHTPEAMERLSDLAKECRRVFDEKERAARMQRVLSRVSHKPEFHAAQDWDSEETDRFALENAMWQPDSPTEDAASSFRSVLVPNTPPVRPYRMPHTGGSPKSSPARTSVTPPRFTTITSPGTLTPPVVGTQTVAPRADPPWISPIPADRRVQRTTASVDLSSSEDLDATVAVDRVPIELSDSEDLDATVPVNDSQFDFTNYAQEDF